MECYKHGGIYGSRSKDNEVISVTDIQLKILVRDQDLVVYRSDAGIYMIHGKAGDYIVCSYK